jgi:hypothetical protein
VRRKDGCVLCDDAASLQVLWSSGRLLGSSRQVGPGKFRFHRGDNGCSGGVSSRGFARGRSDEDKQTDATAGQRWGMEMMRGDGGSGTRQSRNNMMLQIPGTRAPNDPLSLLDRLSRLLAAREMNQDGMTRLASLIVLSLCPASSPWVFGQPGLGAGGE